MSDPLQSARIKLARANLHKATARREAVRFFNRHPNPTFRIEPEGNQGFTHQGIGSIITGRVVVDSAPPELPLSFSARFGDAIHNYRSALDHIAWQLVCHGARWPLPDKEQVFVQFPIYETAAGFQSNKARRLPGVPNAAVDFIEARHNYVGGNTTNNALLALARLSNDDKHRALHVFLGLFRSLQSNVTFIQCEPISWENPPDRPAIKEGAVVAHYTCRVTGEHPEMHMKLTPKAEVVVEKWGDFYNALEVIRLEVVEVLNAPEILAAVS